MIKATFGKDLDRWIERAFPFLFWRSLDPNALTLTGVLISAGAAICFAQGAWVLAGLLMLFGGFFDLVDGVVARHFGSVTPFGALLDSAMDRLVDMMVLFGLVLYYGAAGRPGMVVLVGVVLVASLMTSYVKARAEADIPELRSGFFERGERVGLLAAGAITGWMTPVLWILAFGTTFTVAQRFAEARRVLSLQTSGARAADGRDESTAVFRAAGSPGIAEPLRHE